MNNSMSMSMDCLSVLGNLGPSPVFRAILAANLNNSGGDTTWIGRDFERASYASVVDHEGMLSIMCKPDEARFVGARRVENHIAPFSKPNSWFYSGAWTTGNRENLDGNHFKGTIPNGEASAGFTGISTLPFSGVAVRTNASFDIKISGDTSRISGVTASDGSFSSAVCGPTVLANCVDKWGRICVGTNGNATGTLFFAFNISCVATGSDIFVEVRNVQIELVDGRSNRSPSEVVPVGLNDLNFQGLFVDDLSATGTGQDCWSWTLSDWKIQGGFLESLDISKTVTSKVKCVAGKRYRYDYTIGGISSLIYFNIGGVNVPLTSASGHFTAVNNNGATIISGGVGVTISQFTIHEVPDSSGVSGVQYFDYENGNSVVSQLVIESAGAPIPASTLKGVLIEAESTNINTYSENMSLGGSYTLTGCTLSVDTTVTDPAGHRFSTRLTSSGGGTGQSKMSKAFTTTASKDVAISTFVRAGGSTWCYIETQNYSGGSTGKTYFDIGNGVIGSQAAGHDAAGIEELAHGWYRIWIVINDSDTTGTIYVGVADADGDATVARDGTANMEVYGLQVEDDREYPTSYTRTPSSSTATRSGDYLWYYTPDSIPANLEQLSTVIEVNKLNDRAPASLLKAIFNISNSLANEGIILMNQEPFAYPLLIEDDGAVNTPVNDPSPLFLTAEKFASSHDKSVQDMRFIRNGAFVNNVATTATSLTLNPNGYIEIGSFGALLQPDACIKNFKIYNQVIADAALERITA